MEYKYKCGNETIRVWCWDDDFHNNVTVYTTDRNYDRTIREDKNGKFFTWNKHKIYLDDWIRISMSELKQRIANGEDVFDDDLCQAIMTDGVENARFIVPFKTRCGLYLLNGDEFENVLCKVEESWNREVKRNYKLVLVPVEPNDNVASCREFYTCDMVSLIKCGDIEIVI